MKLLKLVLLVVLAISCKTTENVENQEEMIIDKDTRPYYMGFTPWPYDATNKAISNTYEIAQQNGDIIAHHLMEGIPWQAALDSSTYPTLLDSDINFRINSTNPDTKIYLSIDSLNGTRDGLAYNYSETGVSLLTYPWNEYSFNDQEVIDAYINYCIEMINRFQPDYFNYAAEVSDLIINDPAMFNNFSIFSDQVYSRLKKEFPDLPLMVSIALKSPDSYLTKTINDNFSKIENNIDMIGVSVYPFAFFEHFEKGNPLTLPETWLSQIRELTNKPIAITETGWISEDLIIENYSFHEISNQEYQAAFLKTLLEESEILDIEFIIWFTVVDYDRLWRTALNQDDIAKIWKDSGLFSPSLEPKISYEIWQEYFSNERK